MKRRVFIRTTAAIVAVLAVAATGVAMTDQNKPKNTTVVGIFADASTVDPGTEVRAAGVKVGDVSDVKLQQGAARVTMTVDESVVPIHRDARLTIRPVNLLGEHYVQLDSGSPEQPYLDPPEVPLQQTSAAVDLQDVLNTFDDPTSTAAAALVTTLGEGVQDSGGQAAAAIKALEPAMRNTQQLGGVLGTQNATLTQLLDRLKPVAQAIAGKDGKLLDQLVGNTERTLSTAAANQQALDQTMAQLPGTVSTARSTLSQLAGVSDAATPTLRSIRPVTDNLTEITGELNRLADAADPALASLRPVLDRANSLLDQAAPAVADLRKAGPGLRNVASNVRPVGDQLLDQHLGDLMEFVRKWSLSTNGRDALSHYFRGVVFLTPATIKDLAGALLPPPGVGQPAQPGQPADPGKAPPLPLPGAGPPNILPGAPGPPDPANATGLTPHQEQSMLGQLLGGG